ncbi:MAG: hypothetical protein EHM70_09675 [Chloroflexota bacterium]|nr:MAG: hypothetical protein EHM70_09675 [Chloroflexota bacterium]
MKQHEKWLYQENTASQGLMLLYLLGNSAFIIGYVNRMNVDYELGIFVLLNIFLSLVSFLVAVRQKAYAIRWGYAGIALGVYQFLRLAWIPEEITNPSRILLVALLIVTGIFALAGSTICIKRSLERQKFIVENQIGLATFQR